jgi:uncharacterized protein YbjT (DUF2867 family)
MKMTVFGATGRIGGEVVRQALDAGHDVTAVVRDPARFEVRHAALEVAKVPGLTDPDVLRPALEGSEAAISGVGPRGRKDGPVASTATRGILRAMEVTGVRRFEAVSAVPVGPVPAGESFVNRRSESHTDGRAPPRPRPGGQSSGGIGGSLADATAASSAPRTSARRR